MNTKKQIPLDVIFDIFTSLPVKSLVRFKCISKSCSCIITSQEFATVHATRHSDIKSRTIVITCSTDLQSAQMFFSTELQSPQMSFFSESGLPQEFGSIPVVHLKSIPPRFARYTTPSVNGLICMDFGLCATIFNPSTREAVTLPFVCPPNSPEAASTSFCVNSFGFDPIMGCYKVLNCWGVAEKTTEYRVFTLGKNNNSSSWRLLGYGPSHLPKRETICIDGIIYFKCHYREKPFFLFAFHVYTEQFNEIPFPDGALNWRSDLVQLSGRLALVDPQFDYQTNSMRIWVLEDYANKEWIGHRIAFPYFWKGIVGYENFKIAGTIPSTGEILLAPGTLMQNICVYLWDFRKSFKCFELTGLPKFRPLDFSSNAITVTIYEQNIFSLV